jgi:hypothetical protein
MAKKSSVEVSINVKTEKPKGRPPKKILNERDKLTRNEAIRLFCTECMGYQVFLIKDCPDVGCPLWNFRAGSGFEHTETPLRKKQILKKKGK